MTETDWGGGSGDWDDASNWSSGIPTLSDTVVTFDDTGMPYDVTIKTGEIDFVLVGTANVTSMASIMLDPDSELTLGGTINLAGSITSPGPDGNGTLIIGTTGYSSVTLQDGGSVSFAANDGTIITAGPGSWTLNNGVDIEGSGEINGEGGLTINNDSFKQNATANGIIDADNSSSQLTILELVALNNMNTLEATNNAELDIQGITITQSGAGNIYADGGTVELVGSDVVGGVLKTSSGSYIDVLDSSTFDGTGAGGITITSGSTIQDEGILTLAATSGAAGTLDNQGILDVGASTLTIGSGANGEVILADSGALNVFNGTIEGGASGDVLENNGESVGGWGSITAGSGLSLINLSGTIGAFSTSGPLTISTGQTIQNDATLAASDGTLDVSDPVSGTGSLLITDSGVANFTAAFNQNTEFQGAGELTVTNFYAGTISGSGTGDSLDLKNVAYAAGDHFALQSYSGGVETFAIENSSGDISTDLSFSGSYVPESFLLSKDGGGAGTLISFHSTAPDDFKADGKSDLLIENTSGAVVVGEDVNGAESYTQVAALGSEWSFKGNGDFLGDGNEDFLIENANGAVDVGEVVSGATTYAQIGALGSEWKFVGSGDYLNNGQDQILIESTSGAIVVGNVVSGQAQYTQVAALGSEWSFEGSGDFFGEDKTGFLIENTNGAVDVGEVGGNDTTTYTQVAALGSEWKFIGTGDFLGNGQDQFLIENTNGALDVGNVVSGQAQYTQVGALGPEWSFIATGDYLGAGISGGFIIENTAGAVVLGTIANGQATYTQVGALGSQWTSHS